MKYYLMYQTPKGKIKERFFQTDSKMNQFIIKSKCLVIYWRELED